MFVCLAENQSLTVPLVIWKRVNKKDFQIIFHLPILIRERKIENPRYFSEKSINSSCMPPHPPSSGFSGMTCVYLFFSRKKRPKNTELQTLNTHRLNVTLHKHPTAFIPFRYKADPSQLSLSEASHHSDNLPWRRSVFTSDEVTIGINRQWSSYTIR